MIAAAAGRRSSARDHPGTAWEGQTLLRRAARIAARCGAELLAVHISRPDGPAVAFTAPLLAQRRLTESADGTYHHLISHDIAAALLTFVRTDNATQLVITIRSPRTVWPGGH